MPKTKPGAGGGHTGPAAGGGRARKGYGNGWRDEERSWPGAGRAAIGGMH